MKTQTKSQKTSSDFAAGMRARMPIMWVCSPEESRVERYLLEACAAAGYTLRTWDCGQGACDMQGKPMNLGQTNLRDPGELLGYIMARATGGAERVAWILRDFHSWLQGPMGIQPLRQLCNIARARPTMSKQSAQAVIILTASSEIPSELNGHTTVINWPRPDREEIAATLRQSLLALPEKERAEAAPNGVFEQAVDAAVGLTESEAASCYGRSLVQTRKIDPVIISNEKKRMIAKEKVLEWHDPLEGGLDSVGGLDLLKAWLKLHACAYSKEAREYGLPAPKGIVLVGERGCGKSMVAKAIASFFACPLLRADLGALKGKFVGESEARMRRMIDTIEATGRCVVWFDEIEKALQGATSGSADGGTSADQLAALLNWLQERSGEAFIIATSNDAEILPPELLRKGRFDEIFFVGLPTHVERVAVLQVTLRKFGRGNGVDAVAVADKCEGFSGAELASLVPDAMFTAFSDGKRDVTTEDLLAMAKDLNPMSKQARKKSEALQNWKKQSGCRDASFPESAKPETATPNLDM